MLGGGILNLKVAFALLERGLRVTLIVQSPQVLSQLMEPEDAALIRDALNNAGLKILTGAGARRVLSNGKGVSGVLLDDGREIACEMVCIGKGVQPNVNFDHEGIQVDRGVVVDSVHGFKRTQCLRRRRCVGDLRSHYRRADCHRIVDQRR